VTDGWLDATETAGRIRRGEITALEAVDAAIARCESLQPELNFLVTPTFERARRRAESGTLSGPFAGVPYLVKDMYDVEGVATRWGARFGPFLPPATADCEQVRALEAAGLVVIGKSALGEIGYLPTTEPLVSGPTRNPWNLDYSPGGSSGGSAAAVAAGVVPMADAADGGGSIRIPASVCGLFGLKPSRDRLVGVQEPSAGYVLTAEHCVSRTVRDSAALFAAMQRLGSDAVLSPVGPITGPSTRRLRVGVAMESIGGRRPDDEVEVATGATAALLERLGHLVEPATMPFDASQVMANFLILWASSATHVVDLVRSIAGVEPDESLLEPFTLAMAALAASLPAGSTSDARAALTQFGSEYDSWFAAYDVILSPVVLTPSVPIGHIAGDVPFDILVERISAFADYTPLQNASGAPAMSVPLGWTAAGLPVGAHFAARTGDERTLFELAYELEEAQPWADRWPPTR
jgi:amidase